MDFHWITELNWREGVHVVVGLTLKMAMEEDGEFSSLMCPEYDAGLTVKELSSRLQNSGFAFNHCDILEENNVDGNLFTKLTRSE